jgi:hypothetical protein
MRKVCRTGSLYDYPLYAIGERFEHYFRDAASEYYRAFEGLEIVEFRGIAAMADRGKVVIQFIVDYHYSEIEPYIVEVNGELQDEEGYHQLIDTIFDVETPFRLEDELEDGNEKNVL